MDIREYQQLSLRTINDELIYRDRLMEMVIGANSEFGEVADIFKKYIFQGHELDKSHVVEELGDVMFYIVNLCSMLDIDMKDVLRGNVSKLESRYPDGFSSDRSVNREV